MINLVTSLRRFLIKFGKSIPFILCFIIAVSYTECLSALVFDRLVMYEDFAVPYTPLSYKIASVFEYDWLTIFALIILCYSIETCLWNKMAIFYAAIQLVIKSYVSDMEMDIEYIYAIVIVNLLVSSFFCYKGIKIIISR